ncbi:hypothetical protein WJX73_001873 [Symbiochloris irregularis]|uniref:Uncharacterized protein n=1 Tax=Symbiochloris irregularis TaxID=706552 RepID=A0AAW1NMA8_9CHLO
MIVVDLRPHSAASQLKAVHRRLKLHSQLACRATTRSRALDAPKAATAAVASSKHVLLFDVMDTIVWDPFFTKTPEFLGMTLKELFAVKHPQTWSKFERGEINEAALFKDFFQDGRSFDGAGLKQAMVSSYCYQPGMQQLLQQLHQAKVPMHVMSNYPAWWQYIEDQLGLSQYLSWTFISCEGPMKGKRKPEPEGFKAVEEHLGLGDTSAGAQLVLIDDRLPNVEGALQAGWDAIHFRDADQLKGELQQRNLL